MMTCCYIETCCTNKIHITPVVLNVIAQLLETRFIYRVASSPLTVKDTLTRILIYKGIFENPDLLEQLINLGGLDPVRYIQDRPLIATRFKLSCKHLHSVQKCVIYVVRYERIWSHSCLFRLLFMFRIFVCDIADMRPPLAEIVPVKLSPFSV